MLGIAVLMWLLLWRGWRSRGRRQSGLPPLPAAPLAGTALADALDGIYVATTTAGNWQNRLVVQGVGRRARAQLRLLDTGVLVDRSAEQPIWIPRDQLIGVGTAPGIAGKVMGLSDGILLVSWRWGGTAVDSGFRADDPAQQEAWITAARAIVSPQPEVAGEPS